MDTEKLNVSEEKSQSHPTENHKQSAFHLTEAAKHHTEAVKHHENGDEEKAAQSTMKAHNHQKMADDEQEHIDRYYTSSSSHKPYISHKPHFPKRDMIYTGTWEP